MYHHPKPTCLRFTRSSTVAIALLVCVSTPALAGGKQSPGWQAKEKAARKACLTGDYAKGLDLLSELFVDSNDPVYIYNQGRCLEQNHQYQEAIEKFKEFLRTGETLTLKAEDKESAERHIAACKETLGAQAVTTPQPVAPPTSAMTPAPQPVRAPEMLAPTVAQPAPAQPAGSSGSGLRIAGIVTGAAGLVGLGLGIGFNVLANNTIGDEESTLNGYAAKNSTHDTYVTLAWVGYGVAPRVSPPAQFCSASA